MGALLYEEVAEKIKQYVKENQMEKNSKLPSERKLAEMFGTSRNVIREALKLLVEQKVIEVREKSGVYVLNIDEADILDAVKKEFMMDSMNVENVLYLRDILEPSVVDLCVGRITPEQLNELREVNDNMRCTSDMEDFAKYNIRFHELMADATGNSALYAVMCLLYNVIGSKIFRLPYTGDSTRLDTIKEHDQLISAFEDQDLKRAKRVMKRHLNTAKADYENLKKSNAEHEEA